MARTAKMPRDLRSGFGYHMSVEAVKLILEYNNHTTRCMERDNDMRYGRAIYYDHEQGIYVTEAYEPAFPDDIERDPARLHGGAVGDLDFAGADVAAKPILKTGMLFYYAWTNNI